MGKSKTSKCNLCARLLICNLANSSCLSWLDSFKRSIYPSFYTNIIRYLGLLLYSLITVFLCAKDEHRNKLPYRTESTDQQPNCSSSYRMAVDVMLCPHGLCPCGNSNTFGNGFFMAHRPTAGLSLDGSLTQLYCSMELNLIVACVTWYKNFLRAPSPVFDW